MMDDVLELQEDLVKLSEWAVKWLMSFTLQKCEHLSITNKRHHLQSTVLTTVLSIKLLYTKYLGVIISQN